MQTLRDGFVAILQTAPVKPNHRGIAVGIGRVVEIQDATFSDIVVRRPMGLVVVGLVFDERILGLGNRDVADSSETR